MCLGMFILLIATIFCLSVQGACLGESPILSKVTVKGSLIEKDRFSELYLIHCGERFNDAKHKQSVEQIKEALKAEGYKEASVQEQMTLTPDGKAVHVLLTLLPGPCYTIAALELKVSTEKLHKELFALLKRLLVGQYCSKDLLTQAATALKNCSASHGFMQQKLSYLQKVNYAKKTVTLVFELELAPQKRHSFTGNRFYTDEQLHATCAGFDEQKIELPACFFVEELKALYKKRGFLSVAIDSEETLDKTIYTIQEGPRTLITSIVWNGPCDAERSYLEKTTEQLYGEYDEEMIRKTLMRCRVELQSQGYWDVVLKKESLTSVGKEKAVLTLNVQLGERRMIEQVILDQYPFLLNEEPFCSYKQLKEPCALSLSAFHEQKFFLQNFLRKQGYLYTVPSSVFEEQEGKKTLVWTMDISTGPVRFGKTAIVGLVRTRPSVVERELWYKEGDPWNSEAVAYSVQRLKRLGIFSSVSLGPGPCELQEQPLLLTCIEDDPFEVRTRLGFHLVSKSFTHLSWTTYKVGGSFVWKNPTGVADILGIDLDFTRYSRMVSGRYEVPWIGIPVRMSMRVYSDAFDQPLVSRADERLYRETHNGASVTFFQNYKTGDYALKLGCESATVRLLSERLARVIQFDPCLVDKPTPYLYCEPLISFESVDSKGDPCYGWSLVAALKAMIPLGIPRAWFIRAVVQQSFFYPFSRSVVGAFRWQCGHIFNAQFSTILPTERFYLGGSTSIRGYETNMVPPLNDVICDGCTFWVPVGGKTMGALNAELRMALYKKFSWVVFIDGGILTQNKFADIAANRWFGASGFGIRWATPLGPLRFDIGWKWRKRDPQDRSYAFFLTMGQAF